MALPKFNHLGSKSGLYNSYGQHEDLVHKEIKIYLNEKNLAMSFTKNDIHLDPNRANETLCDLLLCASEVTQKYSCNANNLTVTTVEESTDSEDENDSATDY